MSKVSTAAKAILSAIQYFSQYVLKTPLRAYQIAVATPIIQSVLNNDGLEFLVIFPRQAGKNELVTHILVYLLNLFQRIGGQVVFAAIGDGIGRAITRLEEHLENSWNAGKWAKSASPTKRSLGKAAIVFLSSHPQAHARGETAHLLLIVDELQDQDRAHLEAVFTPMRAAKNATAVYLGTVRTTNDALWLKKRELETEEQKDGIKRVFIVTPEAVIAENQAYGRFLQVQIAKYGRKHPTIAAEYFLEPINSEGGLFPPRRIQLMQGTHSRQTKPIHGQIYVATIDVAGQDEEATNPQAKLANPQRNYTACTIYLLKPPLPNAPGPNYEAVDIFTNQGARHFETYPGMPSLMTQLTAFLRHWNVTHVIGDASGVGAGIMSAIAAVFGEKNVTPYIFSPTHKANLGNLFLSLVETNRFKYWQTEVEIELSDAWWFFKQAEACQYYLPDNAQFEKDLQWSVPNNHKTDTPLGSLPTNDDRLMSASLIALADDLYRRKIIVIQPQAESVMVKPKDPLDNLKF